MKAEQLEIMKVIEFPKNRNVENKLRDDKLEVAIKFLKYLVGEGADFHIIIDRNAALELFEDNAKLKDYLIMTTDFEKARHIKLDTNYKIYKIEGNEFD